MNVGTFVGNLGKQAEVRTTKGGTHMLTFSLAVNSGYGDNQTTMWVKCIKWDRKGGTGEALRNLAPHLGKGSKVAVMGELGLNVWDGNNGPVTDLTLTVRELTLIDGKKPNQDTPEPNVAQNAAQDVTGDMIADEDIPFMNPYKGIEYLV